MRLRFFDFDTAPPTAPPAGEVHVWAASLDRPPDAGLVTAEEAARAVRFKMERIRNQFLVARGLLRSLLGSYLGLPAAHVPITYEAGGKPVLTGELADWHFNLSHSEALAVYAFTRGGRIGVDIERLRPMPDAPSYVERFFSPHER